MNQNDGLEIGRGQDDHTHLTGYVDSLMITDYARYVREFNPVATCGFLDQLEDEGSQGSCAVTCVVPSQPCFDQRACTVHRCFLWVFFASTFCGGGRRRQDCSGWQKTCACFVVLDGWIGCLLYTSPSPRDRG